jgi:hypothetical protein
LEQDIEMTTLQTAMASDPAFEDYPDVLKATQKTNGKTHETAAKPFARSAVRLDIAINAIACASIQRSVTCIIKDLSTNGAKIELIASKLDEKDFVLYIPNCKVALNCTRIWRRGMTMGVLFQRGRPELSTLVHSPQILAA